MSLYLIGQCRGLAHASVSCSTSHASECELAYLVSIAIAGFKNVLGLGLNVEGYSFPQLDKVWTSHCS